ncbi:UvrD-helicase domain-containing protein [Methylovorus menthalis]|uniref:UvrD-helicase domain-containing protein n=1 Tax=Methylovorus menthalis TaxID=1002227 RepID=UPI001E2C4FD8|nr:UvrD-helicase domain-containing protein [Methylovorus menthalis]MCB4811885.1 UvrD-helicase domain-containing protein [Methylovorus menthalis]
MSDNMLTDEAALQDHLLAQDDESRRRALELESFIVEAPAGAGKTELLTQRYLKLLTTVREPEEIIAITFTNKAAAEMRARILDSLLMAASGERPPQPHKQMTFALGQDALEHAAQRGWHLLENPARLRIFTIDSLSSHLARQMPLMSRFGAQPAVTEDASAYYQLAAERTLDLADGSSDAVTQALRYVDNDSLRLTQLLADMLAKRDQWLPYANRTDTRELAEAALQHLIAQDMQEALAAFPVRLQQVLMPIARYAATNLPCEAPIALLRDWETPMPATPNTLPMWLAACELLFTGQDSWRKTVNVNTGFPAVPESKPYKEQLAELIAALQATAGADAALCRLRCLPVLRAGEESWQVVSALAQLLNLAVAQLWFVFQEAREVDFVEISQRALNALADDADAPSDLALRLDYRIQHLLVDEFQDTSPGQVHLLQRLTRGWEAGDGRTLFAVGDPMQSIYRFRKANVGLFLEVAREGIGDIHLTPLQLCRNNRSCPPVVDWINHAFAHVFPREDSIARGAIRYRPFVATRADEVDTGVVMHPLIQGADESNEQLRTREASLMVKLIREEWAAHPQRRIAVLVRARSHLEHLVAGIRRHHRDIRFQAVEIEALAGRQIIQDMLALTHALHHRADRVNWLAILRAPWCGLTLADLHALAASDHRSTIWRLLQQDARLAAMSEDGRQRALHVRGILQEVLAQQGRLPVSRWLHSAWLMLGGPWCLWEPGDVQDVQAFFALVDKLDNQGQFTPTRLAEEVEKLYAAADEAADGRLQLMTIHKSKGLEFDAVILPGLERKTGNQDSPLLLWEEVAIADEEQGSSVELVAAPFVPKGARLDDGPTPYDYLRLLEKERAEHEDARVLYVAATRTERRLHLIATATINAKGEPRPASCSFLQLLWPQVALQFAEALATEGVSETSPQAELTLADFVPPLVRLQQPQMPAILQTATPFTPLWNPGEASESLSLAASLEADIGTLAHRYLELMARQGLPAWPEARIHQAMPAMQRWLQQQGHAEKQARDAAAVVVQLLLTTLCSVDGQWVLQAREGADAEVAWTYADASELKRYVVDRTFMENGVRWIIDYKSVALPADISDAQLRAQVARYRLQLDNYAGLFADQGILVRKAIFFLALGRLVELAAENQLF